MNQQLLFYTLQLADNALINGHRLSEWCGHGPVLEQDIAISNIALDHLGRARSLYQYAAELFNALPPEERSTVFNSPALQEKVQMGALLDEDDLAYLRDGWDFRNVLLVEQPNEDWAFTIARSFYFDVHNFYFFEALKSSTDKMLASIAEKSLKEIAYHLRWSSEWVIRLGDGTDESHQRMQNALNERWMFTGELNTPATFELNLQETGAPVDLGIVASRWMQKVTEVITEATLKLPASTWMQQGGKNGVHSEHLGYVLAELQFMQRAYPDMEW